MKETVCITQSLYGLKDFIYDQELGVYRYPSGIGIKYADGGEDYITETLRSAKDLSAYSDELTHYIKDWPSRYHLSPARNNLMEGIAGLLDKNSRVLEIGSGCGAITRWLGERFPEVDAIEGNLPRAVTTRMRTSGLDNVNVYFGDVSKTAVDKKYDIITLIGVMEYVPFYEDRTSDPEGSCIRLLKKLNGSLSERGMLVLAIENKMGAKYFSGCNEDHCGKHFIGVQGYPEISPVTFSRNELESMLRKAGFDHIQFYHLFPDYKLTGTMMPENEETLALKPYNWIKTPFEDYKRDKQNVLLEPLFLKTLTDAGLLWQFSNSFLVLASRSENVNLKQSWLIKKFNNESHGGKFRHQVTLEKTDGQKYRIKRTPAPGNERSIRIEDIAYRLENEEYISGELLSREMYKAMLEDDQRSRILRTVKKLHEGLITGYSTGRSDASGYPLVRGDAVDYTFWNNIVSRDGTLHFIDRKWSMLGDIPADFVLFRNLYHIYYALYPFIYRKCRRMFVLELIREFYPRYSSDRLKYDIKLEEEFQSIVSNRKITISIDYPPREKFHITSIVPGGLRRTARKAIHFAKARL